MRKPKSWFTKPAKPATDPRPILERLSLEKMVGVDDISRLVLKFVGRPPVVIARFTDDEQAQEVYKRIESEIYG